MAGQSYRRLKLSAWEGEIYCSTDNCPFYVDKIFLEYRENILFREFLEF